MRDRKSESGQVLVIIAVWLVALIGSAALILLTGSVEWQRNQLQQLADGAALDSALRIGIGCTGGSASTVITEADNFVATQRTRTGTLTLGAGSCAAGYAGTDTFSGGLSETIHYPYRAHQQQVEVILSVALPISFGNYVGASTTNVTRRAVGQQLSGSTAAVSATTLSCSGGQFNVAGSVVASNAIALSGSCAVYAHDRFDAASSTYSDLGNVSVYANGQSWVGGGGRCVAGANTGSSNAMCTDGYELSGHTSTTCGTNGTTAFLSAGDAIINADPCAGGTSPQPVPPLLTTLPPEPNADPAAIATLQGNGGAACTPGAVYPNIAVGGVTVATGVAPVPSKDASGFYHFKPSCYGYLNPSLLDTKLAVLDPGFYYFNGSGFSGGGGICLNSSTLLARGVTLEFVNAAGLSSGGCTPGGGGGSTFWLQGTNDCAAPGCHLQTTDPSSGQQSVKFTPSPDDFVFSETVSGGGVQIVPSGTTYTLTYSSNGGRTINATITLYYSVASPCGLPSGATNLISWATALPDFSGVGGTTVTSPAAALPVVIPSGAFLCLDVQGATSTGNENFLFNDTNHPGKISTAATILPSGSAANCTGTCQLGSTPCSISVCPPNVTADSAGGGYTWFAAPCSQAPAGDASCPGSAWCPAGDRACWNLLVWAPASTTGQIAIKGSSVQHWLLGSVYWPGTCTDTVNGTSTLDGTIACGTLSVSAAAGAGTAVGSDFGVSTALVEAVLVE